MESTSPKPERGDPDAPIAEAEPEDGGGNGLADEGDNIPGAHPRTRRTRPEDGDEGSDATGSGVATCA